MVGGAKLRRSREVRTRARNGYELEKAKAQMMVARKQAFF